MVDTTRDGGAPATVVVIGAGAAGLAAAWHAARRGYAVTLVEPIGPGGQLLNAGEIETVPGLTGLTGPMLVDRMCAQLDEHGVEWVTDRAADVRRRAARFVVTTEGGAELAADAVIVASGSTSRPLDVPGAQELEHRGVSHCAACDGPLFRGRPVAVVGGGDAGADAALLLSGICPEVHLIERGEDLTAVAALRRRIGHAVNVRVLLRSTVRAILGDGERVTAVEVRSGSEPTVTLGVAAVFVSIGTTSDPTAVSSLVSLDASGCVVVGATLMSSEPGVFAAGAARSGASGQLAGAIGDGVTAAASADRWLAGGRHEAAATGPDRSAPRHSEFYDYSAFFDAADAAGIGDGLPLVPPTARRLARFAAALDAAPDDVLVGVGDRSVLVGDLLTSAIMAGCRPEHMPVVRAAAVSLLCDRDPSNPLTPDSLAVVVVNGPVRTAIDLNCADGLFGPGWRSNATIGRALRLLIRNHVEPGPPTGFGDPGQFAFCFGEDEEHSPWTPFHVQRGLGRFDSAATMFGATVFRQVMDREHTDPDAIVSYVNLFLRGRASGTRLCGDGAVSLLMVIGHQLRSQLASRFSKETLAERLFELATADDGTPFGPIDLRAPADISVVAAGGLATPTLWCFVSPGPAPRCVPLEPATPAAESTVPDAPSDARKEHSSW